jgi:hypothetical protein
VIDGRSHVRVRRIVVQVKCVGGEVILRKLAGDGKEQELTLDADEAARLLGANHLAVREARAYPREARVRELASSSASPPPAWASTRGPTPRAGGSGRKSDAGCSAGDGPGAPRPRPSGPPQTRLAC